MIFDSLQLIVTVLSVLLFLRIYWIQASSNSLVSMMSMQQKELLNEIELDGSDESCKEMERQTILSALSYLNLVSKLYLNYSININMLKTFEGVMIKLLKDEKVKQIYEEVFYEFRDKLETAEPPYINLIYTTQILRQSNKILNERGWFSPLRARVYISYKKIYFSSRAFSRLNWKLAENVFESRKSTEKDKI